MHTLSPAQAGQLATRGRQLLRRRVITPHQYALLDAVLWAARKPGSATLLASMTVLARLAGQGRRTVARGLARLEELGLLARIRRRVRVPWGGSIASRVVANGYVLQPLATECQSGTASKQPPLRISLMEAPIGAVMAAQQALKELAKRRTLQLGGARR
jgi:hypothetical protein